MYYSYMTSLLSSALFVSNAILFLNFFDDNHTDEIFSYNYAGFESIVKVTTFYSIFSTGVSEE